MRLIEALRVSHPARIAFVGAGGKTTALFQTAREILDYTNMSRGRRPVIVTTTTHLGSWQASLADQVYIMTSLEDVEKLKHDLPAGVILVAGEEQNARLGGLHWVILDELYRVCEEQYLPLLIEADGAHGLPLKAPDEHEPNIPEFIQQVVVVAGLAGLGKPLTNEWVHRPDQFAVLTGLKQGDVITGEALAKVMVDKQGGLKNIPCGARRTALINQADTPGLQALAKGIGELLLPTYAASIVASLNPGEGTLKSPKEMKDRLANRIHAVIEPIAAIILAAGGASRFGKPKQLLPWKGQPLVRHSALAAIQAGLAPVVVIVGSSADDIKDEIKDLQLRIVNNQQWADGMSSSIKAGIRALPGEVGAAVFLQCDQPQIPPTLIRSLVEAHQTSLQSIIAPQIDGQRGNPVLFDARTFPEFLSLEGDVGGKALFSRYPIQWVTWHDANLLLDIDSPEDYERFLKIYSREEGQA